MELEELNDENFIFYATSNHDDPQVSCIADFHEDINRIKYIKRLLSRYILRNNLKERLIINHIIVFLNVFGIRAGTRMLFYKLDEDLHSPLKTFLIYLHSMPNSIKGKELEHINLDKIPLDINIIRILRKL